jgi:hypothetical protein
MPCFGVMMLIICVSETREREFSLFIKFFLAIILKNGAVNTYSVDTVMEQNGINFRAFIYEKWELLIGKRCLEERNLELITLYKSNGCHYYISYFERDQKFPLKRRICYCRVQWRKQFYSFIYRCMS